MKFTVYGIRLKGGQDIRYIGFTRFTPAERLHRHVVDPTYGTPGRPLRQWLLANVDQTEAVCICKAKTEAEARAMEKGAIAAATHAGARLFNSDHVPKFALAASPLRAKASGAAVSPLATLFLAGLSPP